jgi:hypothetical protein
MFFIAFFLAVTDLLFGGFLSESDVLRDRGTVWRRLIVDEVLVAGR